MVNLQQNNDWKERKTAWFVLIIVVINFILVPSLLPRDVHAAVTLGSQPQINVLTPSTQKNSDVAIDAVNNAVYVWAMRDVSAADPLGDGVYFRRFDASGTALDPGDVLVNTSTTGDQTEAAIAMDEDGNFVVVWSGNGTQSGQTDADGIFLQAFQNDGTPVGGEIRVNTTTANIQREPSVSIDYDGPDNATRIVVSWTTNNGTDDDIAVQQFIADFTQTASSPALLGSEMDVNTYVTNAQNGSKVAMNNLGEFMVTWVGDNGSGTNVLYQMYAQDGVTLGVNEVANTATAGAQTSAAADKIPRPSLDDDNDRRFVVAYEADFGGIGDGIAARQISCSDPDTGNGSDTDLNCTLNAIELVVVDDLAGTETLPDVDADYLGNFVITWQDSAIDGAGNGVAAQSFNYFGQRVGANFQVNAAVTGDQESPKIALNQDGFYAASFTNLFNNNIFGQRYVTSIFRVDTETVAHPDDAQLEGLTSVAIAPNGNIAIAWKDHTSGNIQLTMKRYDAASDPPAYVTIIEDVTVATASSIDYPSVDFFKDTAGTGVGNVVVTWESDQSGTPNVYYRLYDAAGSPLNSATAVNGGGNDQTVPTVAAGYYNSGGTGSGPAIEEFVVAWFDSVAGSFESAHHSSTFTYNQLGTCSASCGDIDVDYEPGNRYSIFVWDQDVAGIQEVFARQMTNTTLTGSSLQITSGGRDHGNAAVAFISSNDYAITYTDVISGSSTNVLGRTYEFGGSGPTNGGAEINLTQHPTNDDLEILSDISGDIVNNQLIAVWGIFPLGAVTDDVFGQFFTFDAAGGGTDLVPFGPSFRINSTVDGVQSMPSVSLNELGQTIVGWEGDYGGTNDGAVYQLLQNSLNTQLPSDLTSTAQQQVQAGGQFLDVPTTITFPDVLLSTDSDTVQAVSVRDATYGGDVKYVEVQDATGVDFTLTVQISDFFSVSDGRSYIKNDQHVRVRNWDQDTAVVDDISACQSDPDSCYRTLESTRYPTNPTAFTLHNSTQNFVFADTQQVLAEKIGTVDQEIGRWRLYPEFEVTVPPLVPPGAHNATITFTLT